MRDAQSHPRAQGQPAALLRRTGTIADTRVHVHRAVPESAHRTHSRRGAGNHLRSSGPAAERGQPVPADRKRVSQSLRRPFFHRRGHRAGRRAGRLHCRQPAVAEPGRAAAPARAARRSSAPQRNPPPAYARIGTGGVARTDSIAGAGAALAESARVLPARAVEGYPKGIGRRRRREPRRRRPAPETGGRRAAGKRARRKPCGN